MQLLLNMVYTKKIAHRGRANVYIYIHLTVEKCICIHAKPYHIAETAADALAAEEGEGAGSGVRTLLPLGPPSAAAIRSLQQIVVRTYILSYIHACTT